MWAMRAFVAGKDSVQFLGSKETESKPRRVEKYEAELKKELF